MAKNTSNNCLKYIKQNTNTKCQNIFVKNEMLFVYLKYHTFMCLFNSVCGALFSRLMLNHFIIIIIIYISMHFGSLENKIFLIPFISKFSMTLGPVCNAQKNKCTRSPNE